MPKNSPGKVEGGNVLYHYLQKSLQEEDVWLFQMLVAKLVVGLGIWFPPSSYAALPIALPHVVRDPDCRGSGDADQWSSPNSEGYVRDDNFLVKALVRSFTVNSSAFAGYRNRKLGTGFVSAHAWRTTSDGGHASRNPLTNSFWPNLVWLPANVAKLTDREGSFTQTFVQAISFKIYRGVEVHPQLRPFVEEAWSLLPAVSEIPDQALPDVEDLNFFDVPSSFLVKRLEKVRSVSEGLGRAEEELPVEGKVVSSRYAKGLADLKPKAAGRLREHLDRYAAGVEAALPSV